MKKKVLILILLDNGLPDEHFKNIVQLRAVLILILLDNGLPELSQLEERVAWS